MWIVLSKELHNQVFFLEISESKFKIVNQWKAAFLVSWWYWIQAVGVLLLHEVGGRGNSLKFNIIQSHSLMEDSHFLLGSGQTSEGIVSLRGSRSHRLLE